MQLQQLALYRGGGWWWLQQLQGIGLAGPLGRLNRQQQLDGQADQSASCFWWCQQAHGALGHLHLQLGMPLGPMGSAQVGNLR